ncbi:MAG: phage tail tape measure C-terminal domain-containing protein [Pseudaminobacter sp.]
MADTTAVLGIEVDSRQAESDLRRFEAIAKKTGETVEQVRDRYAKASAQFIKGGPALQNAANGAAAHATQLEKMAVSTQKASAAAVLFTRTIQGMIVALAGGGLYKALEASINGLAALGDRARDTRLPVEVLQGLRMGAADARVSTDELNKALDHFTAVSKKATPEAKELLKALSNVNPALADAFKAQAGKSGGQEERLRLIADALKNAKGEVQRYQVAQQALGTDQDRVIDLFVRGRQALDDYIEEARKYGVIIGGDFIKKSQDAQRTLGLLSNVLADKLRVAIVELIPDLMRLVPYLVAGGQALENFASMFLKLEDQFTGTLKGKIAGFNAEIESLQEKNSKLAAGEIGSPLAGIFPSLRDDAIKKNDEQIKKFRDQVATMQAVLTGREVAEAANKPKPKPTNDNLPGFAGRPSLKDDPATPFDRAVNSINRHIAAMNADAEAVGKTSAEHARLRVEAQLVEAGLRSGLSEAAVRSSEKFKELGRAAQDAAQKLALARINDQIKFDRDTGFLSQQDVQIAQQLRDIYPDVATALSSVEAQAMRVNDAMRELSSSIESNLTSGLTDIVSGAKSASDGFRDMADSIIKDIERMVIKMMIVQPLMKGLQGIMGGIVGPGAPLNILPNALGGVFPANDNGISRYSNQIVSHPTIFPFARGVGLMGEAGPEAIMPLKRAPDGSLGVAAHGSSGGLAGLKIEVVNPPGVPQTASVERSSDGSTLRIVLKQAVEGIMADDVSSNGPISQMISARQVGFGGR